MDQTNTTEKPKQKNGVIRTFTVLGYVLIIVFCLMVAPIVLPPIFGYHTYYCKSDTSGLINTSLWSLVYAKEVDATSLSDGNLIGVLEDDHRNVTAYYVESNNASAETIATEMGNTVSYDSIVGRIVAKTPFMGLLCGIVFLGPVGIVIAVLILLLGIFFMIKSNKMKKAQREANREWENAQKNLSE